MRAYVLVHSALSGVQKGIQAAHCLVEMGRKNHAVFEEWARKHKTLIVLEGGFHADLEEAVLVMEEHLGGLGERPALLPWAAFREDEETMNGMLTAVGVVVPERIYGGPPVSEDGLIPFPGLSFPEAAVWGRMYGKPLAR